MCLSVKEYETATQGCVRVHVAGNGNFPTGPPDMTVYKIYRTNWPQDESFASQTEVFEKLAAECGDDFDVLLTSLARSTEDWCSPLMETTSRTTLPSLWVSAALSVVARLFYAFKGAAVGGPCLELEGESLPWIS